MEGMDNLYVLDKSLEVSKVDIDCIDGCGFAEFTINGEKHNCWLKGPSIQTAHYVFGNNAGYLVSLDYKFIETIKAFIQNK